LSGLSSGRDLRYERASYQLPIGGNGLRLGVAYFDTGYRLGKEFSELEAHGIGAGTSVFATYPVVLTQLTNVITTVSLERKHLTDYVDATATLTEKHLYVGTLGISGSHWDTFGGSGLTSVNLSVVFGDLTINSEVPRLIDDISARTDGKYLRFSYTASRLQRLTSSTSVSLTVSGQKANKNLDSSEKFSLGGAEGVRAYPQGEDIGDEGYMANLEIRRTFLPNALGVLFYDAGSVITSRNPFVVSVTNSRKLAGTGVGLNANMFGVQIKAAVAYRTQGGEPTSVPPSAVHRFTGWVQFRKSF
jgi:hemolysin activation/secretion protein